MRPMRRGARGDRVKYVQNRLQQLGYHPGAIDGIFGYVTEDALLQFQRDQRLRRDGVIGRQVMETMKGMPAGFRHTHVVQSGERVADLARRLNISEAFIRQSNGIKYNQRLQQGDEIVIRLSLVLGDVMEADVKDLPFIQRSLSAAVDFGYAFHEDGFVPTDGLTYPEDIPVLMGLSVDDVLEQTSIIKRKLLTKEMASWCKEALQSHNRQGVLLTMPTHSFGRRLAFDLLKGLVKTKGNPLIIVSIDAPDRGTNPFFYGVDYRFISELAHRIVIPTHAWDRLLEPKENILCYDRVDKMIGRMARIVPRWKLLLGIPLGASVWNETFVAESTYKKALLEGYAFRQRPVLDSDGMARLKTPKETYVIQTAHSLDRLLRIVHMHRLGGVYFRQIGSEDQRLRDVISGRIHPGPLNTHSPNV